MSRTLLSRVLDCLYISSAIASENVELLEEANVKHVLAVGCTHDESYLKRFDCLCFPTIQDLPEVNILPILRECNRFIKQAEENGESTLVHCVYGQSRSVTVVLSYLLFVKDYDFSSAFDLVKRARPEICVNPGFLCQLFCVWKHGECSIQGQLLGWCGSKEASFVERREKENVNGVEITHNLDGDILSVAPHATKILLCKCRAVLDESVTIVSESSLKQECSRDLNAVEGYIDEFWASYRPNYEQKNTQPRRKKKRDATDISDQSECSQSCNSTPVVLFQRNESIVVVPNSWMMLQRQQQRHPNGGKLKCPHCGGEVGNIAESALAVAGGFVRVPKYELYIAFVTWA